MAFETKQGEIKVLTYVGVVKDSRILMVQYEVPPEPDRKGWWIPSPELKFGEHPEEAAKRILQEFNLRAVSLKHHGIESFQSGKTWNLLFSYIAETDDELRKIPGIRRHGWFQLTGLPAMNELAHGPWEQNLAISFLE